MIDTTGGTGGDSRTIDCLPSDKKQHYNSNDYRDKNVLKETSAMRKSQDNQNYINMLEQQAEEWFAQCQNKVLRAQNNSKFAMYSQRRKSDEPNFPINGLSVKGNYNPPIYSSTKKQQLQLNTDRGHYCEKNKENFENLNLLIGKDKMRSRNSDKFRTLGSDKKSMNTLKNNSTSKRNSLFKDNPVRMYNTIEDAHFIPEFEIVQEIQDYEKIGPDSFIPIQLLGKGSFGEVYLVQKRGNKNELYAMKILQKDKIFSNNLVRYAMTERNVLSYFTKHPFIVKLNYAFQTATKLFLILDYCPGGDLGQLIRREGYLEEEVAKVYMAEILLALEDLHNSDIIFRDLKPDNVVIGKDGHVLLTDFGLSKEGILDNKSATSFWGSVAYLAPEMLKRQGHGKSVDWYLLGVLLYEMIIGKTPYFSESKEELFHNIKNGKLKINRNLTPEAIDILKCLLNRNPNKRLGAGKGGANLIKSHPFFKEIDWELCLQRKSKVPKPVIREITPMNISSKIFEDDELSTDQIVDGWSFVTPGIPDNFKNSNPV